MPKFQKNSNLTKFQDKIAKLFDISNKDIEKLIETDRLRSEKSKKMDLDFLTLREKANYWK